MTGRALPIVATGTIALAVVLVSKRLGVVHGQQKKAPGDGSAVFSRPKGRQDLFGQPGTGRL